MKSLGISIGLTVAIAALLCTVFHLFGVADKVAAPLASASLGLITFIHDNVDKALSAGSSRLTPGIVPVSEFDIRWPYMLVYATLTFIAIVELSNLVSLPVVLVLAASGKLPASSTGDKVVLGALISLPAILWGNFLLGRWIGIRSAKAGYWILPLAVLLGRLLDLSVLWVFPSSRHILVGLISAGRSAELSIAASAAVLVLVLIPGIFGVWRGNKVRFGAYFNSLLKKVPSATRDTLLAMTFDEARMATHQVRVV